MITFADLSVSIVNAVLSVADLVLVAVLLWAFHTGRWTRPSAIVRTTTLLLYAVLAAITPLVPLLSSHFEWSLAFVQVIALAVRIGILIVLLAWVATSVHAAVARRWPNVGAFLDAWVRVPRRWRRS